MPEAISVVPQATEQASSSGGMTTMILGGLVIFIAVLIAIAIIVFLVYLVYKFIKFKDDPFYKVKRERKKMCKLHADKFRMKQSWWKFWKITDNQQIICQYEEDKKIKTKTIGYYKGHYQTDNCMMIAFVDGIHKWLFIFPEVNILILNKKEKIEVRVKDEETQKMKIITLEYPRIVENFTDNFVLINALGIDNAGYFFVPIVKDKNGRMVDLRIPAYCVSRDVILSQYLYQQTCDFTKTCAEHIRFNPFVKVNQEINDGSKSLDTQVPP